MAFAKEEGDLPECARTLNPRSLRQSRQCHPLHRMRCESRSAATLILSRHVKQAGEEPRTSDLCSRSSRSPPLRSRNWLGTSSAMRGAVKSRFDPLRTRRGGAFRSLLRTTVRESGMSNRHCKLASPLLGAWDSDFQECDV